MSTNVIAFPMRARTLPSRMNAVKELLGSADRDTTEEAFVERALQTGFDPSLAASFREMRQLISEIQPIAR